VRVSVYIYLLEAERWNTMSHYVENSLWKKLCSCSKTSYWM